MAVFREALYCTICGERLIERHKSNDGTFIGDTFIGYEDHKCRESKLKLIKLAEEKGIHNLVSALKDHKNNDVLSDIDACGWVRCSISNPGETDYYLVTNGKEIWIGHYGFKIKRWLQLGPDSPFKKEAIVAWTFKPDLSELKELLKPSQN